LQIEVTLEVFYVVHEIFGSASRMKLLQSFYPVTDTMLLLLSENDSRMFKAVSCQFDEVRSVCAEDISHTGGKFQMIDIFITQQI